MIQRHPLLFALGLALIVALPTLFLGFWIDDYYHLAILELRDQVEVEIGGPLDLFYFAPGDPDLMQKALDTRPLPWFTLPELHLHFFRPLTSGLFSLEHAVWGLWPLPYHIHSVLWYLLLVCTVWAIYRRVLPWGVAILAAAIFAIDDVHTIPVLWIANRNGLLAVTLVLIGFLAHLAWRRDGRRWGLPASVLCYALGLCAGEAALGAMAYVAAFEVVRRAERGARNAERREDANSIPQQRIGSSSPETRNPRPALLALLPATATVFAYLIFYKISGYGVSGSGLYLDPLGEPFSFLRVAPARILSLIGTQVLAFPSEISIGDPRLILVSAAAGVVAIALVTWLFARVWTHLELTEKRTLSWLVLGGLLSLLPIAATFPSSRLLMAPSFGFAGAVAMVLWHGWHERRTWRFPAKAAVFVLAFIHCIAAPGAWWIQTAGLTVISRYHDRLFESAEILDDPAKPRLVYLRAPEPFSAFYATAVRALHGHKMPQSTWSLSLSPEPQEIARIDDRTVEITMLEGRMLDSPIEQLFRTPDKRFAKGDVVHLDGLEVTILETDDGFPTKVRYTFAEPLETGPYQFVGLRDGRLVQVKPPALGETQALPQAPGILGLELKHLI